jgi:hypothetical protein
VSGILVAKVVIECRANRRSLFRETHGPMASQRPDLHDTIERCRLGQDLCHATWSAVSRQLCQSQRENNGKLVTESNPSLRVPAQRAALPARPPHRQMTTSMASRMVVRGWLATALIQAGRSCTLRTTGPALALATSPALARQRIGDLTSEDPASLPVRPVTITSICEGWRACGRPGR